MGVDAGNLTYFPTEGSEQEFRNQKNFFATFALPPSRAPPARDIFFHCDISIGDGNRQSSRDVFVRLMKRLVG